MISSGSSRRKVRTLSNDDVDSLILSKKFMSDVFNQGSEESRIVKRAFQYPEVKFTNYLSYNDLSNDLTNSHVVSS